MKKQEKGITLVALVIAIILLLILSGITISSLKNSGLFENAKLAKEKSENLQKLENETLGEYEDTLSEYINGTRNSGVMSNYSENEIQIGTWIDGKKLYRKVIKSTVSRSTEQYIPHKIDNMDVCMLENAYVVDSNVFIPIAYDGYFSGCVITNREILIAKNSPDSYGDVPIYFVLIYTKTTN